MGKVIVNADDFGLSRGVNYGIWDAVNLGIVTSVSLLANGEAFDQAAVLARELPRLGVGVHLTLTSGRALAPVTVSYTREGSFYSQQEVREKLASLDKNDVYTEWQTQIEKVIQAGIRPTHLDSHHHLHTLDPLNKIMLSLAVQYDLPIRGGFAGDQAVVHADEVIDLGKLPEPEWQHSPLVLGPQAQQLIEKLAQPDRTFELITHPGYLDRTVAIESSLRADRYYMTHFLIHGAFAKAVVEHPDIELITYRRLSK